MDVLPPHHERARQPVEPHALGHRPDPLRHPRHRFALVPLRHRWFPPLRPETATREEHFKRHRMVPFLIPGP
nr:hypothetical protein [Shinella zoogloeoides]